MEVLWAVFVDEEVVEVEVLAPFVIVVGAGAGAGAAGVGAVVPVAGAVDDMTSWRELDVDVVARGFVVVVDFEGDIF